MQQEIIINIAVAMFGCFVANEIGSDFFGDRKSRGLKLILSNAVYIFLLTDVMSLNMAYILFPFVSFVGYLILSFNYEIEGQKRLSTGASLLVAGVVIYAIVYMLMRSEDEMYQVYIIFIAMEYIAVRAYTKMKELSVTFMSILFLVIPVMYVVIVVYVINNAVMSGIYRGMMLFGVIVVNILMMAFYNEFLKQNQRGMRQKIAHEQNLSIEKQIKTITEANEAMSRVRHDMTNHILVINNMLELKEYDRLKEYIGSISDNAAVVQSGVDTGNIELDAIINSKRSEAEALGIDFRQNVLVPVRLKLSGYDMAVMTGNILDNAIRSVAGLKEKKRFIDFNIYFDRGALFIRLANPYRGKISFGSDGLPVTTKKGGEHGIGLSNVKNTVEKYDGEFNIYADDNNFYVDIAIYGL